MQVQCMNQGTQSQCSGTTQRDGVGREVGGGSGWGDTCAPVADSCRCMAKTHHNTVKSLSSDENINMFKKFKNTRIKLYSRRI